MGATRRILILGASYGSLLGTKLALAGHDVDLVCRPGEAELINQAGAVVRLPVRGREGRVEVNSKKLPGRVYAGGPGAFQPAGYDLIVLAMQEPQYRAPGVRELMEAIARSRVPCLSIWAMLIAGNYRCVTKEGMRSIRDAVHGVPAASRAVYEWVVELCLSLGADEKDLVPFEKYASAALSLESPSAAARAVAAGATDIERVDRLVQAIARQKGMRWEALDRLVVLMDERLEANRRKAA